jgi:integral membrane protein (TIGR01906 family)
MRWLIVTIVVVGVIASVAFDAVFEIFHELFFPAGSFTFDPRTDHLVQLVPFDFWSETTIVLGGLIIVAAALISVGAGRLAKRAVLRGESGRAESVLPASAGIAR